MELTFLGTNGWYDNRDGNTVCALLRGKKYDIVLDAGNGLYKLDQYVDGKKPVFMFLSHFHIDHIAGLHTLCKLRLKKGLTICGQRGTRRVLGKFINSPFTVPLRDLTYPVRMAELPKEAGKLPFKVSVLPLVHADPVLGYRIELDGKVVTYITDTGYCANALKLARGADLLITECANLPGEFNPLWPHFSPETAAKLAVDSGAKRLVMTHFSAARYTANVKRAVALRQARKAFPKAVAATDGIKIIF
jgi:ribonuclease BN (tRNA processing enzyme)